MVVEDRISLWDDTAAEPACVAQMSGDRTVALAIVGGGFTGLSTALHAAQAGMDCLVLEAETIGYGGSGRNVGLVNAGVWLPPHEVGQVMGEAAGRSFVEYLGRAPAYVFDLIERHQIRCEPRRSGTIHAAHSAAGVRDLQVRAADWAALKAPVRMLDRDEAAERIGSKGFYGGLLDERAGTINPMGYVRGLARAAQGAGAEIATGVTVTTLRRDGAGWVLETTGGRVRARYVVLGTNAYTDQLWPGLKACFNTINFFQFATEPMGEVAAHILPRGQGLWDTAPIMLSLRRDAFGRVIIGSMGSVIGGRDGLSRRWAMTRMRRLFPELGKVSFESAWHGQIAMTPDHLPRILRLDEGLYTLIGYNGRGITTGTVFGKAMAELLSGAPEESLPLALTSPQKVAFRGVKSGFYRASFAMNQLIRSI